MSISLVEVAGANFRTDEQSDHMNTKFMRRLGLAKRYLPARLAISCSLANPSSPDLLSKTLVGKTIKGDTLFGTSATLSVWLALIVERAGQAELDIGQLTALVAAHWQRGLQLLDGEWERSDEDVAKFVRRLVDLAGLPLSEPEGFQNDGGEGGQINTSIGEIIVPIGEVAEDIATGGPAAWSLNSRGGSPHSAIMGGVGSGKTRTAAAMLDSIRQQVKVPLLAFDFKGDLGTDASGKGYHIDKLFGATTLQPPHTRIPLDVLSLTHERQVGSDNSTDSFLSVSGDQIDIDIDHAALRFRESFSRLKGTRLGDRQKSALHEAAVRALKANTPCELHHIRDALSGVYEEHEMKEDGAISMMRELCSFPLFEPKHAPELFFQQNWIIKLPPSVSEDRRTIVVNLVLDALDQYLNSQLDTETDPEGARGLRILCMIDEAHQILRSKLPSLSSLIRMSRSKGGAIMMISQSPDDFSGEDDEFLSEMGLVAAFSTNAPPRHAARILGKGADLGALQIGQCYAKLRGDRGVRKIRAWGEDSRT